LPAAEFARDTGRAAQPTTAWMRTTPTREQMSVRQGIETPKFEAIETRVRERASSVDCLRAFHRKPDQAHDFSRAVAVIGAVFAQVLSGGYPKTREARGARMTRRRNEAVSAAI
jgi:hypothetical protein